METSFQAKILFYSVHRASWQIVALAVHRENGFPVVQSNEQVAAFARSEAASLPFKPSLQLTAGHYSI
jgi:hypothetical protein